MVTLTAASRTRCFGMAYRVAPADVPEVLAGLDHREKGGYERLVVEARLLGCAGSVQATTWIASPDNPYHLGPESLPAMVAQIREAAGPSGRNIDYVLKLAATLDDLGIVDPHVAEIARALQAHGG